MGCTGRFCKLWSKQYGWPSTGRWYFFHVFSLVYIICILLFLAEWGIICSFFVRCSRRGTALRSISSERWFCAGLFDFIVAESLIRISYIGSSCLIWIHSRETSIVMYWQPMSGPGLLGNVFCMWDGFVYACIFLRIYICMFVVGWICMNVFTNLRMAVCVAFVTNIC